MEEINRSVAAQEMISYLQMFLEAWLADKEKYGMDDTFVKKDMDRMLACKSMVETLIGVPVNMTMDGTVTIGY